MENCPVELVSQIFEYACSGDFGETARRLGLVSKYFRAIAEPIELRVVKISGSEQVQRMFSRLENLYGTTTESGLDGPVFFVEHLLISELTEEHALAVDTAQGDSCSRSSFWRTAEGRIAKELYHRHAIDFWSKTTALIKCASSTLRTLCLISSNNWFQSRGRTYEETPSPKILVALNDATFPNLAFLAVNHDAVFESAWFDDGDCSFQFPTMPSLRRLHIVSPVFLDRTRSNQTRYQCIHPLLADLLSEAREIQHLTICDDRLQSAEETLKVLFGDYWGECEESRTLPGNLQNVVLQQGTMPYFGYGIGFETYKRRIQNFVSTVQELRIGGLEAHLPTPMFPGPGRREFELLLAEWREECLLQLCHMMNPERILLDLACTVNQIFPQPV